MAKVSDKDLSEVFYGHVKHFVLDNKEDYDECKELIKTSDFVSINLRFASKGDPRPQKSNVDSIGLSTSFHIQISDLASGGIKLNSPIKKDKYKRHCIDFDIPQNVIDMINIFEERFRSVYQDCTFNSEVGHLRLSETCKLYKLQNGEITQADFSDIVVPGSTVISIQIRVLYQKISKSATLKVFVTRLCYIGDEPVKRDETKDGTKEKETDEVQKKEETKEIEKDSNCCVCINSAPAIVFIPCGHLCACEECSKKCDVCPVCRNAIDSKIKVFKC